MDKPRIGWIGTGVMGSSMAGHLMDAGYTVSVFNRTVSKTKTLVDKGAKLCASPKEVGENSDIVFSIVGYPKDVESVLAGEDGALSGMAKGGIICDMTTSSPSLAVKLAEKAAGQGIISLDAPVTGGDVGARKATLSIFVGGAQEGFDRVLPLLQIMGQKIMHCGEAGMGQQAKMANQVAVVEVEVVVDEATNKVVKVVVVISGTDTQAQAVVDFIKQQGQAEHCAAGVLCSATDVFLAAQTSAGLLPHLCTWLLLLPATMFLHLNTHPSKL